MKQVTQLLRKAAPATHCLVLCLITFTLQSPAQILNKIKNKVEQKAASAGNKETPSNPKSPSADGTATNAGSAPGTGSNHTNTEYPFTVLTDAKFYFSDQPFTNSNTGAKTNFTSQEFIYGRLELGGKTVSEAFKLDAQPVRGFHYLEYGILITPVGKTKEELNNTQTVEYTIYNRSKPILIKEEELKNTWLNFDVLPAPSSIYTLASATPAPEKINEFRFDAGLGYYTNDGMKEFFPANGDYTVQVLLWNYSFDDWGKILEYEKNIVSLGALTYHFSTKDAASLIANNQKRLDGVRLAEAMKNRYTKLPDWWNGKPFTPGDALLKPATLTPMIKNYCSRYGLTYISHKVYPYSGAAGWTIYTDSNTGLQVSRRLNAEVWTLYKDENDRCRFATALIDESYGGAGTYGSPYISGLSGEFIDCSAIR